MEVIPLSGHLCAWTWPSEFSGTLLTPDRPAAHAASFGQVPVHPFLERQKGSVLQNKAVMSKLDHCRRFWKSQVSQADVQVKQQPFIVWEHENKFEYGFRKNKSVFLNITLHLLSKHCTRNFHITPRSASSVPSLTDEETLKGIKQFIQDHTVNHQQANSSSHKKLRYLPRWD